MSEQSPPLKSRRIRKIFEWSMALTCLAVLSLAVLALVERAREAAARAD